MHEMWLLLIVCPGLLCYISDYEMKIACYRALGLPPCVPSSFASLLGSDLVSGSGICHYGYFIGIFTSQRLRTTRLSHTTSSGQPVEYLIHSQFSVGFSGFREHVICF